MPDSYPEELQLDLRNSFMETSLWVAGTGRNMYANRISFAFDFHGPSVVIDTACSSSLVAFDLAVTDIRLGKCDQAIVGATQLNLQPFTNFIFQNCQFNSPDGISRVWDKDADGFVRAETVGCVLLQKVSKSKRIYATIIHTKTNIDGYKKHGNFFPSKEGQQELLEETCIEAGIDPVEINYFEAHGTGTKVGDPQEARAIAGAYCKNRKDELLVGLLKSNIGHGEGTSGIASICKAVISFENKCIAANLNLKTIKPEIAEFCPPLKPVNVNTPFDPKVVGINSFGLGGVNAHAILRANKKENTEESFKIADKIPRLINVCGRTQEGLDLLFDFIEKNPKKITRDFLALLNDTVKMTPQLNSSGFPYRGSMIIKEKINEDGTTSMQYTKESTITIGMKKPIWFFFSGMGSQWVGMAKSLMIIDKFAETIHKCANVLEPYKVDLLKIIISDDKEALNTIVSPFVSITAVQIALFELLKDMDVHQDGIIGHSFGEIACAYADGCLTLEQAMLCSYWRGKVVQDSNIQNGMMAAVGLSAEEARKRCPKNVYVACDNAPDSVTISGPKEETKAFVDKLKADNIFVRDVAGFNLKPYHTPFLRPVVDIFRKILINVIPQPKKRSEHWYSTSIPESEWNSESAKYASAEYFVNNLIKPVLFTSTIKYVPEDAIVIEIAPHSLFQSLIKRSLSRAHYIGLLKRNDNEHNLETFLSSLGKLYQLGVNVGIEKLYPKVEWPVARGTQSISSLIRWDHKVSYFVKKYPEYYFPATSSDMTFRYSLDNMDDVFLKDHSIEGRVIFPATGYLMLAWRRLASQRGQQWNTFPVVFENVQFRRPVIFEKGGVKLTVRLLDPAGDFSILDNGNVACFGKISVPEPDKTLQLQHLTDEIEKESDSKEEYILDNKEFYRELRIRGYDYGPKFQSVIESKFIDLHKVHGKIKWTNNSNVIAFLDSMLQLIISVIPIRALFVPVAIQSLRCDPKVLFQAIEDHKIDVVETCQNKENELDETIEGISSSAKALDDQYKDDFEEIKTAFENDFDKFQERTGGGKEKWISNVPVVVDLNLRSVVGKGVEIRGFLPINIPRKQLSSGLRLEKYQFIPYNEDNAIESYYKNELHNYINLCSHLCLKILKNATEIDPKMNGLMNNFINLNPINDDEIEKQTTKIDDEQTLLKILNHLHKGQVDANKNLVDQKEIESVIKQLKKDVDKPEFDLSKDTINLVGRNERLIRPFIDVINENSVPIAELKVLEVNLTNGIIGLDIEQVSGETFIDPIGINYTIAHKSIETLKENKEIEDNNFQVVQWNTNNTKFPEVSSEVNLIIHRDSIDLWKIDLHEYFNCALSVVKSDGFLLAIFRSKITQPEQMLSQFIANGFKVPDEEQLIHRINYFEKVAIEKGFRMISKKSDSMLFTVVLFRKINKNNQIGKQKVIEVKTERYEDWFGHLQQQIREIKDKQSDDNIWFFANDTNINGVIGLVQCLRMESGGDKIRCIFDPEKKLPSKVDFNVSPFRELFEKDLMMNIYKDDNFGSMRHLYLSKDDDKVQTPEAYVNVLQRGDLSSMQWFDGRNLQIPMLVSKNLKTKIEKVQCDVYYSSLNFRDVMMATGRIAPGLEGAVLDCLVGYEFAGRRKDNGERVFGSCISFGIGTTVTTNSPLIFKVPDHWSLEDAATISTVYMTVWYGLIDRANLVEGESILIHSGSGGVGQAAINVCQHYGCKIFTTVGTQEKRDFLKKTYGLTDDQMFSSRDTDFEEKILTATQGKGVNLVLNSLAEEKLQASFRCVADDGRFIEIGKYDLQMNNPLPMFAFLRNISFHGVALDKMSVLENESQVRTIKRFESWLYDGIEKGFIKPLVRTIFEKNDVKEAFKYMMTGKHIGKVLIKIRDEEPERNAIIAKPIQMTATAKSWFDSQKSYIIIGGLGGMGIEIVYWMMLRGAKKIVVTSRSGIRTNSQKLFFKQLEELGNLQEAFKVNIKILTENAINYYDAKKIIKAAEEMGQIGGVFQLAVVLHDALFENQTVDTFQMTCEPKVDATVNMDKLTRQLKYQLDYFVTFSSIACGRGNNGQTGYGYGNSVMERICEQRRKEGLHGLAIQWGPIGDVGLSADTVDAERIKLAGLMLQRLPSWLYAFDRFIQSPHAVVASTIRIDKQMKTNLSEDNMMQQLWAALGIDPKTVPDHVTLGELGMESFVAVELQRKLERDYDAHLSLNEIRRITIGELKDFQSGNRDKVKIYAADIKIARTNLSKLNFEIASEPFTKLNNVKEGTPAYFLPPIEGIFSDLLPLIQLLPFPVYGLNWTHELDEMRNIKEISLYYMKLLKTIQPNGNYILLSYSFGTGIAMKMCFKKAPIKKLFIIDSFFSQKALIEAESSSGEGDQNFEMMFKFINRQIPKSFHSRIRNNVLQGRNEEDRINRMVNEIKDFGDKSLVGKDLEKIVRGAIRKAKMLSAFKFKLLKKIKKFKQSIANLAMENKIKKIECEIVVVKTTENVDDIEAIEDEIFDEYGIHKQVGQLK